MEDEKFVRFLKVGTEKVLFFHIYRHVYLDEVLGKYIYVFEKRDIDERVNDDLESLSFHRDQILRYFKKLEKSGFFERIEQSDSFVVDMDIVEWFKGLKKKYKKSL